MSRIVFLLVVLAAIGAGLAWLGQNPPAPRGAPSPFAGRPHESPAAALMAPAPRPPASVAPPAGGQAALATPFGDALFRWRCTAGLREALGDRPDWPLERIAGLCLCAADRLREDGPRDIVLGTAESAGALEEAESRICRRL